MSKPKKIFKVALAATSIEHMRTFGSNGGRYEFCVGDDMSDNSGPGPQNIVHATLKIHRKKRKAKK